MATGWIFYKYQYFLLLIILYVVPCQQSDEMLFEQTVHDHGYPLEIYEITTKDNYVLTLYRIPHGMYDKENGKNKSIVLLVPGQGEIPLYFTSLGPKEALSYYMADKGFDVWILCSRGLSCSSKIKHKKYDWNKDRQYWDFSWHHIGVYDVTASINFILLKTNQTKLFLIGDGNANIFAMCSEKPQYNEKIKIAVTYAPSVILRKIDYPMLKLAAQLVNIIKGIWKIFGVVELIPYSQQFSATFKLLCNDPEYRNICYAAFSVLASHKSVLVDLDKIMPLISKTLPVRVSAKQIFHYFQIIKSGQFQKYDLGVKNNLKTYGQKTPTMYNLSNCDAPMAFFHAPRDSISVKEDVHALEALLPNVVLDYEIEFDKFTHTDFLFAKNASKLVYKPTYELFKKYDEGTLLP